MEKLIWRVVSRTTEENVHQKTTILVKLDVFGEQYPRMFETISMVFTADDPRAALYSVGKLFSLEDTQTAVPDPIGVNNGEEKEQETWRPQASAQEGQQEEQASS